MDKHSREQWQEGQNFIDICLNDWASYVIKNKIKSRGQPTRVNIHWVIVFPMSQQNAEPSSWINFFVPMAETTDQ